MRWYVIAQAAALLIAIEVRAMPKNNTLTEVEFERCFHVLLAVTNEHQVASDWLELNLTPKLSMKGAISVVSAGSGNGDFDALVIKHLLAHGATKITYYAVEPSDALAQLLEKRLNQFGSKLELTVLRSTFETAEIPKGVDLAVFAHSLYYIPDRAAAIRKAFELINEQGKILFVHQTQLGISQVQRKFMAAYTGDTQRMFNSEDLLNLLQDMKFPYFQQMIPATLDISDCLDGSSQRGDDLIRFFLESNLNQLNPDQWKAIRTFLNDLSIERGPKRCLYHPVSITLVARQAEALPTTSMIEGRRSP